MQTVENLPASAPAIHIDRIAWGILLVAFALFCMLCAGLTLGVYLFFFESTAPLPAVLQVGRGTALLTSSDFSERGIRVRDPLLDLPILISMDTQSQSTISFYVPRDEGVQLIAAVTLKNDSSLRLRQATIPRFDWSRGGYFIDLRELSGEIDVLVASDLDRSILVQVGTGQGVLVQMTTTGRYVVDSSSTRVRLTTREGEAIIFARNRNQARLVTAGQEGVVFATRDEPALITARENLLENGYFSLYIPANVEGSLVSPPGRWGCANTQDALPRGAYGPDSFEGRPALRLIRGGGADTNGQTRCRQPYASPGADVREFNFLELETTFLVNYQSLSKCGTRGSECPLMLRIEYVDVNDVRREWYQGFYYFNDPVYDYPNRCESCIYGEHRQINEKVWYTFKSGNLFTSISADARPAHIRTVEFYASGHQYDLFVSEISLFAGFVEVVPPTSSSGNGA